MNEITRILNASARDHSQPGAALLPLVYEELRKLASSRLRKLPAGQTLQATALVHEAWLRVGGGHDSQWENRAHFFAAAAEAMRRILIDRYRRKQALRHGGDQERVALDQVNVAIEDAPEVVVAVNEALERLAEEDERDAEIVKMRYFLGLTHAEIGELLGISEPTVRRRWAYARAWLYAELQEFR